MPIQPAGGNNLLWLYRRLLRSAATFPSKNRIRIFESIREEFRENLGLDPSDEATEKKVELAYQGLAQLQQFDQQQMAGGNKNDTNWNVTLEQNPMPAPENYERKG
jgi:methylphosphotriester-DNA--protein-cysteine methyltransferase